MLQNLISVSPVGRKNDQFTKITESYAEMYISRSIFPWQDVLYKLSGHELSSYELSSYEL